MKKTIVINLVAMTKRHLEYAPHLSDFAKRGGAASITPVVPAVTCTVQSTYLTGKTPAEHGIVGNGWYDKEDCEIKFWKQSNKLVQGEKIWDKFKKENPKATVANMFWWYNMYSTVDYSVTPRPMYLADGRKMPDVYSEPAELRDMLQEKLGQFPLFNFWGPNSSIKCSEWIAAASKIVDKEKNPDLTFIYLPHLDYGFQKYGPFSDEAKKDVMEIDRICGDLISYYRAQNAEIIILSEYGIMPVDKPVHINHTLREAGFLSVRTERGLELLDAGKSEAFAVADHQIAHIYVKNPANISKVKEIISKIDGVGEFVTINHERAGDLVVLSKANAWFTYYYWLDDKKAPDFARTVEIHRKPGYDPVELFMTSKFSAAWKLALRKLGFRKLLNVIPLDATLVKGSHGRIPEKDEDKPILLSTKPLEKTVFDATEIFDLLMK